LSGCKQNGEGGEEIEGGASVKQRAKTRFGVVSRAAPRPVTCSSQNIKILSLSVQAGAVRTSESGSSLRGISKVSRSARPSTGSPSGAGVGFASSAGVPSNSVVAAVAAAAAAAAAAAVAAGDELCAKAFRSALRARLGDRRESLRGDGVLEGDFLCDERGDIEEGDDAFEVAADVGDEIDE